MYERYYTEWAVNSPLAVRDLVSGDRWWFDKLSDESQKEALALRKFDVNRGRFVSRRKKAS